MKLDKDFSEYKVLIVDDEKEIGEILVTVLKGEGFAEVQVVQSGEMALEVLPIYQPDIILLDIMLTGMNGYEVFKQIKNLMDIPILFISAKTEELDRLLGFALGADDYITKPFSAKEVAFRLKSRLKIAAPEKSKKAVYSLGSLTLDPVKKEVLKNKKPLIVTAKEFHLLQYFLENPNRILSKELIIQRVWGQDFEGYDNTISVHIRRLRQKIEKDPSNPQLIKTVIGLGYKLVGETELHDED